MIPFLLDLKNKLVVVIGGGNQALTKIRQFTKEKANIKVIAPEINPEILSLVQACWIEKTYQKEDLLGAFMIVAATNNVDLNEQIIKDAKELGILSLSIHATLADLHSMKTVETNELLAGISTKHHYPAFGHYLEKQWQVYDPILERLCKIRSYILKHNLVEVINRKTFFQQLMLFNEQELEYIQTNLGFNQLNILVFTGELDSVSENFAKDCNALALSYRDKMFSAKMQLMAWLKCSKCIQPMVLSWGRIYQRIKENAFDLRISSPLFIDHTILKELYSQYKKTRLFIIHPRGSDELKGLLSVYGEVIQFGESINELLFEEMIPFILLEGYHYDTDIKNYHLNSEKLAPVLLKNEMVKSLLINHILNNFKEN